VGKQKHLSITYGLSNKCAKNFCKLTVLVEVIVEDVVTRFFGYSADSKENEQTLATEKQQIFMFSTNYKTIIHSKFAEDGSLPDLDNATHQELETVQYERQPCNVTEYVTKLHLVLKLHNKSRDD